MESLFIIGQPLSSGHGNTKKPHAHSEGQDDGLLLLMLYVARKKVMAAGGASGDGCGGSLFMRGH